MIITITVDSPNIKPRDNTYSKKMVKIKIE